MAPFLSIVGALLGVGSFVCWVIILIAAFQDELWKGCVCLLCGFYMLYYAAFEYDAENKWLIVCGWLGLAILSLSLRFMALSTHTSVLGP